MPANVHSPAKITLLTLGLAVAPTGDAVACNGFGGGYGGGYGGGWGGGYGAGHSAPIGYEPSFEYEQPVYRQPAYETPAYQQPMHQQPSQSPGRPHQLPLQQPFGQQPFGQERQQAFGQSTPQPIGQYQQQQPFGQPQPFPQPAPQAPATRSPVSQSPYGDLAGTTPATTPQAIAGGPGPGTPAGGTTLPPAATSAPAAQSALEALAAFDGAGPGAGAAPAAPDSAGPGTPGHVGAWSARVNDANSVRLELDANGRFRWTANSKGKVSSFDGGYTIARDRLTLLRSGDNQRLEAAWTIDPAGGFRFKLDSASDGGLLFVR